MSVELNTSELAQKFRQGQSLKIIFAYPGEKLIKSLNSLFARILANEDQIYLLDPVITILREIIINAVKANSKRVYFQTLGLDINDTNSYEQGILEFKNRIIGNLEAIEDELKKSEYRVHMVIFRQDDGIHIDVINNAPIHPEELRRINMRKSKAAQYNDFGEAYDEVYDSTEGAGLGIVLVTLLLKNSGIDVNAYQIVSEGSNTKSSLAIPRQTVPNTITSSIKDQIINDINGLPTFPKNILELQQMCNDPDASITKIADKVKIDPALTADVLKLSNSAGFFTAKRIENISEAVMTIGLKNLYSILVASSSRRILDARFKKFEEIWNHCNKTAFYARYLAAKYRFADIMENVYLTGLLHDIGKIVLLSTNTQLTEWLSDITNNRKIRTSTVMEEVSIGISHSTIGELIAQKWHFPDYLVETIRFHHAPLGAGDQYKKLVFTTYLANMLCGMETRRYNFYYLEESVLELFKLSDEESVNALLAELKEKYTQQSQIS